MTHPRSATRRRFAAGAAALALITASVVGGAVLGASADPGDPLFDSATYSAVSGDSVVIGGTADPVHSTVDISGVDGLCNGLAIGTGGTWSCTLNTGSLGSGTYSMEVSFPGQTSTFATATLTVTPPPGPATGTITAPANGVTIKTPGPLAVNGTTDAPDGSTVFIYGYTYSAQTEGYTAADDCQPVVSGGAWSCSLDGVITTDDYRIEAYSPDGETLMAQTSDVQVVLPPTVDTDGDGSITTSSQSSITVSGTAEMSEDGGSDEVSYAGYTIRDSEGTTVATCGPVPVHEYTPNNWSCPTSSTPIPYGNYTLYAFQTPWWTNPDPQTSNEVAVPFNVVEPSLAVSITSPAPFSLLTASTVTISGTSGYTGGQLNVALQGASCDAAVDTDGSWSCSINLGYYGYTANYVDITVSRPSTGLGSLASESVSVLRPPSVYGDDDGGNIISYTANPVVNGEGYLPEGEEGDTVVVLEITGGVLEEPVSCTTTVYEEMGEGTYGAWDCSFADSLPNGTYTVSITQQPSWAANPSEPVTKTLYVEIGAGGQDILGCSFTPGTITVGSTSMGYTASLYRVEPGSSWQAENLGLCGGDPGTPFTDPFYDNYVGQLAACTPDETSEGVVFTPGADGCTASNLTPGIWNIYYSKGESGPSWDWFFTIPNAPTLAAQPAASPGHALFTGTGTPGDTVTVVTSVGAVLCTATVTGAGTWSCSADVGFGTRHYYSYQTDAGSGGISAFSAVSGDLTLVAPAPAETPVVTPSPSPSETPSPSPSPSAQPGSTPTSTPAPTWNPATFSWTFTTDANGYHPGDPVTLTGSGLPSGALVEAEIHSDPVHLGTTIARPDGTFILNVKIPQSTPAGTHEFWVTITPLGGGSSTVVQPAKVTILSGPGGPADDGGGGVPGAMGDARNDPGAPSSFTHGITTFTHLVVNPVAVAIAGGIGLALLLLVAFPAELLNSTLESQYDRFSKVLPKVKVPWWTRFATWVDKTPLVSASLMTLAAAIIFGFADPGFGFDITSFRVVLGCFIALFIVGYLASIISGRILGRAWGFDTVLEVKPLTLILTVVGVVVSRLLDFSPGFLIGLLLGMALLGKRTKADEAKSTLVQTGVVFVMALLAWTAYSILSVTTQPDAFGSTLIFDTLVAITTEGMTALFIGLLPLKFLDGQGLFNYSKLLWAGVYALVAFSFVAIVIPAADNWGDGGGSVGLWLTVVGIFAAVCVGIYLYFRFVAKPMPEDDDAEGEPAEKESIPA